MSDLEAMVSRASRNPGLRVDLLCRGRPGSGFLLCFALSACHPRAGVEAMQGIVEYDESAQGFEVPGRVSEVLVARGDSVVAGTTLVKLDRTLAQLELDARTADARTALAQLSLLEAGTRSQDLAATEAELTGDRAEEAVAQAAYDRQKKLVAQGVVPAASLDAPTSDLAAARARRQSAADRLSAQHQGPRAPEISAAAARYEAAEALAALAKEQLARSDVTAAFAGLVLDVQVKPGEVVAPGTPAVTIADVQHPYADVFVPVPRAGEAHLGGAATVVGSQATYAGRVEDIAHRTEFTPRFLFSKEELPNLVLRVRVRIADPRAELHAGTPAFVTFAPATSP